MPKSALPEHIDEAHEWNGKDDDQHWYTKWRKYVKSWFAFGPRATERWARWREYPVVLFGIRGRGVWRGESSDGSHQDCISDRVLTRHSEHEAGDHYVPERIYLSRVQLFCRWHIQIQWPLFVAFHWYSKSEDVLRFPDKADMDGKLWFFYFGAKRDADRVYWCPAVYVGRNWK